MRKLELMIDDSDLPADMLLRVYRSAGRLVIAVNRSGGCAARVSLPLDLDPERPARADFAEVTGHPSLLVDTDAADPSPDRNRT